MQDTGGKGERLSFWRKLSYGAGNLGYGAAFQALTLYALFYATEVLGLSAAAAGAVFAVGTAIDAVVDPLVGHVSDITRSKRFGRRHAYLLFGGIGMAACITLFWLAPWIFPASSTDPWAYTAKLVWFAVWLLLFRLLSTVYAMPYNALAAELCENYNERTALQGFKTAFFVAGLVFSVAAIPMLFFPATPGFAQGQKNPAAYPPVGMLLGALALVFSLITLAGTFKYIPRLPGAAREDRQKGYLKKLYSSLLATWENRDFRYVAVSYLCINIAVALVSSMAFYVMTYAFQMNNFGFSLVFGPTFVIAVLSQPLWWAVSRKLDKKPALLLSIGATVAGVLYMLILLFLREDIVGKYEAFIPFMVLAGTGIGGVLTMPSSMVADTIDKTELETGRRTDGTFFGMLTLLYKSSQAVTVALAGLLVDRFKADNAGVLSGAGLPMGLVLCIGCAVALLAGAAFTAGYRLTKKQVEDIQAGLAEKRKAQGA